MGEAAIRRWRGLWPRAGGAAPAFWVLVLALAALIASVSLARSGDGPEVSAVPAAAPPPVSLTSAALPVSFAANRGQDPAGVRYSATALEFGLALRDDRAVLDLPGAAGAPVAALSMRLLGAGGAAPVGTSRLPGVANYLGSGPAAGAAQTLGVPTFGGVDYAHAWPGIDVAFRARAGRPEYDFTLAPGADPGRIRLRFAGQERLALAADGSLVAHLRGGRVVRETAPRASQVVDGRHRSVASRFVLEGRGRVGIAVGPHDPGAPLRIDPRVLFSTYVGRGTEGPLVAVARGPHGNIYAIGTTQEKGYPTTPGAFQPKFHQRSDSAGLVVELSPNARRLIYATYFGDDVSPEALAVDGSGQAYFGGYTYPRGIPTTAAAFQPTDPSISETGFVSKLSADGRRLLYSTYLTGSGEMGGEVNGLAIDGAGDAYVTGATESADFPVAAGAAQGDGLVPENGFLDTTAFVAELNPQGSGLVYSTFLGGSQQDRGQAIAIDAQGNAYVTGLTESQDFPVTSGAFETTSPASGEMWTGFVTKVGPGGTRFVYSTYLGGSDGLEEGSAIAVTRDGRAIVAGDALSRHFPTTAGALQRKVKHFEGSFVSILAPDGGSLAHSTIVGSETQTNGMAVDAKGDVFLTGVRDPGDRDHHAQPFRGFLAELDPSLSHLRLWSAVGGGHARAAGLTVGKGVVLLSGGAGPGLPTHGGLPGRGPAAQNGHPTGFLEALPAH
jgi:hypothetical protein